jgi:hypothetical protein
VSAASTPPFLLWAVGYKCPIRGFQDGSDPERTERQLRAALATSEARRAGRVFEGYAVDEPLGFRIGEALALYGGLAKVEETCGACPANAVAMHQAGALAGCVGMLALPIHPFNFYEQIERTIDACGLADDYSRLFSTTRPRWFGFWMSSPVTVEQTSFLAIVFEKLKLDHDSDTCMKSLLAGLCVARDRNLPLHARIYPRGAIVKSWWQLEAHCPRCTAECGIAAECCKVCDYEGRPAPQKKRRARGRRPYLPLARLMGEQKAVEFVTRYLARGLRCEPPHEASDPHSNPLQEGEGTP